MFIELTTSHCPTVAKEEEKLFINVDKIVMLQGYKTNDDIKEDRTYIVLENNQRISVKESLVDVLYSIDSKYNVWNNLWR